MAKNGRGKIMNSKRKKLCQIRWNTYIVGVLIADKSGKTWWNLNLVLLMDVDI